MLTQVIHKIKTTSLWCILWVFVVASEILTVIIVSIMSIIFRGRVTYDYLITGAVTCLVVASIIVAIILYLVKQLQKIEETLRRSEILFRTTVTGLPLIVFTLDREGVFTVSEGQGLEILNIFPDKVLGKSVYEVFGDKPEILGNIQGAFDGEKTSSLVEIGKFALQIRCSPILDQNGKIEGVIGAAVDITKRKLAEEELKKAYDDLKEAQARVVQSEKLASLGQMAAGAAHEIDNPLFAILGEAEMLFKDKGKDKETKDALKVILEQSNRIKGIIERLLEFSRRKPPKLGPLDINDTVEESISLLGYQTKSENIEIVKQLDPDLPKVLGDSDQIQEVFLNIMLNAVQAMEERGKLTIRSHSEKTTKYGRRKTDMFKVGQEIMVIEFKDTGKGMNAEILKKVFDPFFTTKEKNTGLGLSICHGIVENHNGIIEVHSKLGEGSTFIVKLPILKERKT